MFFRKAALRPVPSYAIVDEHAIDTLERTLEDHEEGLQKALDEGYRELELRHPDLGSWIAEQVSGRKDELAQSLGYFLVVAVFIAFREAFPRRLATVDDAAVQMALATLEADEELRANDPTEVLDSDDVVALGQPALLDFVQAHMSEAVEQAGENADIEELDDIYRAILVEIIALSHAVTTPSGHPGPPREALA